MSQSSQQGRKWLIDALKYKRPTSLHKNVSELGMQVADILDIAFQGIYHLERGELFYRCAEWINPMHVELFLFGGLATYDDSKLTTLVLLCHERCIRLAIRPTIRKVLCTDTNPSYLWDAPALSLLFSHKARSAESTLDRHPTIHQQLNRLELTLTTGRFEPIRWNAIEGAIA